MQISHFCHFHDARRIVAHLVERDCHERNVLDPERLMIPMAMMSTYSLHFLQSSAICVIKVVPLRPRQPPPPPPGCPERVKIGLVKRDFYFLNGFITNIEAILLVILQLYGELAGQQQKITLILLELNLIFPCSPASARHRGGARGESNIMFPVC